MPLGRAIPAAARTRLPILFATALLACLGLAGRAGAATVVVDPANPGGWIIQNREDATNLLTTTPTPTGTFGEYVAGPGAPPLGTGSFRQKVGTDGNDGQRLMTNAYNGMPLSSITTLGYSTWVSNWFDGQVSYMRLYLDLDNNGSTDDVLFFEPIYQNGAYSGDPVPNQGNPALNMWQHWDALAGGWWTNTGGPPLVTIANYLVANPGAKLATDQPSLRVTAGSGAPPWDNFDGNVDNVTVNNTTYDFETSDKVAAVSPAVCISSINPCVTVPVVYTRGNNTPMRAYSVTIQLSANLTLCGPGIQSGGYLTGPQGTQMLVTPLGGNAYTVDEAILGPAACVTTSPGTLFTIPVSSVAPNAVGTITITATTARDCGNAPIAAYPGASASITIDNTPPTAITSLAAAQQKLGNAVGYRTNINLSWPGPQVEPGATVQVWRKGFGHYPDYDDAGGAVPAVPATPAAAAGSGWTLTGVVLPAADLPPSRDFWYYVAFTTDACGNVSAASNMTGGTLDYHLGDVSPGAGPTAGNNTVDGLDISRLGAHYGLTGGAVAPFADLDVGPTTNFSTDARPTTDDKINFEDLVMFAINYTPSVSLPQSAMTPVVDRDALTLDAPAAVAAGAPFTATLRLRGAGDLQAISTQLAWDHAIAEPVTMDAGGDLLAQGGVALSSGPGNVDAALLGRRDGGLGGDGVLATVTFRALQAGAPAVTIARVDARDALNRPVTLGAGANALLPTTTALLPAMPNPFRGSSTLAFTLAKSGPVDLAIYAVNGRLVRTLAKDTRNPGSYRLAWDGTDNLGRHVAPGLFFVRLSTGEGRFTRAVALIQ